MHCLTKKICFFPKLKSHSNYLKQTAFLWGIIINVKKKILDNIKKIIYRKHPINFSHFQAL